MQILVDGIDLLTKALTYLLFCIDIYVYLCYNVLNYDLYVVHESYF